jgi:hypothetical protein
VPQTGKNLGQSAQNGVKTVLQGRRIVNADMGGASATAGCFSIFLACLKF